MGYRGIAHMGHGAHGQWGHMGYGQCGHREKWGTGCVGHMASEAHRGKWVQEVWGT